MATTAMNSSAGLPARHQAHDPSLPYIPCEPTDVTFFDTAQVKNVYSAELPVSPAVLFDIFEDPASWPKWAPGIGKVVWTSPKPYDVGTTRTVIFWGGMEVYEDFVKWERGKEMAFLFSGTTQEVFGRFGEHYRVEDLGGDRCRLTWTVCYEPVGTFAKIHGWVAGVLKFNLSTYMWWLKRYCRRHP